MKYLLFIILTILISVTARGQVIKRLPTPITDTTGHIVNRAPRFPGGVQEFYRYISENLHPTGEKGTINIAFVIEMDGSVSDVTVLNGLSEKANKEAIRVISESPKWIPGTQNGRPVKVAYKVPINLN